MGPKLKADFNLPKLEDGRFQMRRSQPRNLSIGAPESLLEPLTLDRIPHGLKVRILAVLGTGVGSIRLMEMGLVPGAPVSVIRSAPLGDPIQVRIRDYHLALRRIEAQTISVALLAE
jgi:ferrous iron transport protein A